MVKILSDTSILIELLAESPRSEELVEIAQNLAPDTEHLYSAVSRLELSMGEHHLASAVNELLSAMRSVPLDDAVAQKAGSLMNASYGKKRRQIPDAIIAASAIEENAWLWTLNEKDFKNIPGLRIFSLSLPRQLQK